MITVNITIKAERVKLKLEGCKDTPLVMEVEKAIADFEKLHIGEAKQLVIDIIKQ